MRFHVGERDLVRTQVLYEDDEVLCLCMEGSWLALYIYIHLKGELGRSRGICMQFTWKLARCGQTKHWAALYLRINMKIESRN